MAPNWSADKVTVLNDLFFPKDAHFRRTLWCKCYESENKLVKYEHSMFTKERPSNVENYGKMKKNEGK